MATAALVIPNIYRLPEGLPLYWGNEDGRNGEHE